MGETRVVKISGSGDAIDGNFGYTLSLKRF